MDLLDTLDTSDTMLLMHILDRGLIMVSTTGCPQIGAVGFQCTFMLSILEVDLT
jgi:hypothetical protein